MAVDLDRLLKWVEITIKIAGLLLTCVLVVTDVYFSRNGFTVAPWDFIVSVSMMGVKADWLRALRGTRSNGAAG